MGADAGNHRDQQQRELEEIRRSFQEIGAKMGSVFEPAQPNGGNAGQPALPPPATPVPQAPTPPVHQAPAKGRPTWMLALAAAACLLISGGLGYLLHRPTAGLTWPTVTSIVTRTAPAPKARAVAPPACLQTAQRADEMIDLFTRNVRDRRLSLALKAYTEASQACRKEATP
jgi:hypothetical protein